MVNVSTVLLIVLLAMILGVAALVCLCVWIYRDCKQRGGNAVLWVIICIAASPVIGLILYLVAGRREIRVPCQNCGAMIENRAVFCEFCGTRQEPGRIPSDFGKQRGKYGALIAAAVCFACMIILMIGAVVVAISSPQLLDDLHLNTGYTVGSITTGGSEDWHVRYSTASDGYRYYKTLTLEDPSRQQLSIQVDYEESGLVLYLRQGEYEEQLEISSFSAPYHYTLDGFKGGKLELCLEVQGAKNTKCDISLW